MKVTIQHERFGEIIYSENAFTGVATIFVGGYPLTRKDKTTHYIPGGNPNAVVYVKGNSFTGITLNIMGQDIQVTPPTKWYEYVLAFSIFTLVMLWGSIPNTIFPIVGGAIGGAINGMMTILCMLLMKKTTNIMLKLLIWLGMLVGAFLICYLIGVLILSAFSF